MQKSRNHWPEIRTGIAESILLAALACAIGCAAPGPPLPPTLNLPAIQTIYPLSAVRVGNEVHLHWTTPERTTDKLPVKGAVVAEVCRSSGSTLPPTCSAVQRIAVTAGATDAVDPLPDSLRAGAPGLLAYRIRLVNKAGRDAGLSNAVYAASGAAPSEVEGFAGNAVNAGVEIRWRPQQGPGAVELDRTLLTPDPAAAKSSQATEVKLRATGSEYQVAVGGTPPIAVDPGGMVDRTVEIGRTYRYTAQRVVRIAIEGHPVELRSVASQPLTVEVRDVFPPSAPAGLIAVPAFAEGKPAIDLSWEPVLDQNVVSKVGGYKVYRRDDAGGEWKVLGTVAAAAYRDVTVIAGQAYAYRVTAVSTAGNESTASGEVTETARQVQR